MLCHPAEVPVGAPTAQAEYIPRSHSHEGTILRIAARNMGVAVGPAETAYWRAGSKIAAAFDSLVDEQGVTDLTQATLALARGEPVGPKDIMTAEDAQQIAQVIKSLSSERKDAWLNCAVKLPEYAALKAGALTISDLVEVTFGEAEELFANAFKLDAAEFPDGVARSRFNRWLTHFSRAGYAIDTALDMPRDYANEVIQVSPTPKNRVHMLWSARTDIPRCFNLRWGALYELGKGGVATIRERVR